MSNGNGLANYINTLVELAKQGKERLKNAKKNPRADDLRYQPSALDWEFSIESYFSRMIPDALQPLVHLTPSHSSDPSRLKITVNSGISILGQISGTKTLGALKESLTGESGGNDNNTFAFALSETDGKCEFFTVSGHKGDGINESYDLKTEAGLIEFALHHCIFFSDPDASVKLSYMKHLKISGDPEECMKTRRNLEANAVLEGDEKLSEKLMSKVYTL